MAIALSSQLGQGAGAPVPVSHTLPPLLLPAGAAPRSCKALTRVLAVVACQWQHSSRLRRFQATPGSARRPAGRLAVALARCTTRLVYRATAHSLDAAPLAEEHC